VQVQGAAVLAVVHLSRRAQSRQAAPKITALRAVIGRVIPAGQVTVAAAALTVKSWGVKPPSTEGLSGQGLITPRCPRCCRLPQIPSAVARIAIPGKLAAAGSASGGLSRQLPLRPFETLHAKIIPGHRTPSRQIRGY
jgi:hypothetical protein